MPGPVEGSGTTTVTCRMLGISSTVVEVKPFLADLIKAKLVHVPDVWEDGVDGPRLVLVNRPESIRRDSLVQALRLLLRDANARPEHNTDETEPVDIRVDWILSVHALRGRGSAPDHRSA
jgi:hypothetical protein